MTQKKTARPDLQMPVEAWGTIKGATDKLTWLARIDAAIAAGMVPRSFLHVAVRIATQWLNKETGLTWRSAENLASDIGMVKSRVEELLEDAVAAGLLVIVKRGQRGRGKRSTIYRPAMPDVLKPDGPGFTPDELPAGPGFKRSRKSRRKSRFEQPANPDFGPNQIPAQRDDLPEEVIPEDIIPVPGFAGRTTDADRVSATTSAPDRPMPRPVGRQETVAAKQPPPSATPIGTPAANGADADPAFAAVYRRGREVLGAEADAVIVRLLAAYDDHVDSALDTLAVAADEGDPRQYIEKDIEAAARS